MKIFQIFYNDETRGQLEKGFIPFDNSNSQSKDFYEYSAIREILIKNTFEEDEYVGVLSPRFFEKTGMTASDVVYKVQNSKSDVVSFSPRFDQIAFYKNAFLQGEFYHQGMIDISKQVFSEIGLIINIDDLVSDQTRTIFSNYFVAKYKFWKKYLFFSEALFDISNGNSAIGKKLSTPQNHRAGNDYSLKVFLMERLICGVLEFFDINAEIGFDYSKFLERNRTLESISGGLLMLDSFKATFIKTKKHEYLNLFEFHKQHIPLIQIIHG